MIKQRWRESVGIFNEQLEVRLAEPSDIAEAALDSIRQRICASGISVRRRYGTGGGALTPMRGVECVRG